MIEDTNIMKQIFAGIIGMLVLNGSVWAGEGLEGMRFFHVAAGKQTTLAQALPDIGQKRIIIVGEYHNRKSHHMAQLLIIKALHESGNPLAVGLEMFRAESQSALDRWVGRKMSERDFRRVYYDNWNFPWPLYSKIFAYAREKRIPLVGLNVSRDITRQVAREGFQSLSKEQMAELPDVTCKVDREYMAFIRKAYGAHAHGKLNFTYFCEAQLVWDKVMAINALEYLKVNPERSMVILAGSGHAWKRGIPDQISQRSNLPYTVILPQVRGHIEPNTTTNRDTDYIVQDPSE
jgi:uncharacterized iron-regulated protein